MRGPEDLPPNGPLRTSVPVPFEFRFFVPTPDPSLPAAELPVDIAVVGAGPCGIAVGAAARKAGLSCVLFDRGPVCASLLDYPPYMSFFSTSEKLEVGGVPFITAEKNPTRKEALAYYRRVAEHFELDIRQYQDVEEIAGELGDFRLITEDRSGDRTTIRARRVVIATGGFHEPNFLDVPGEELPHVSHYYMEAHPFWQQDVVVVGGGNSAVETALELYRGGARVSLVHFGETLDRGVKPWVVPDITNRLEKGEIPVHWRHRIVEIHRRSVTVREETTGEESEIPADWVLAMTGWRADPTMLLELGVPVDPVTGIPAHDPETMETPVPGIHIAGVLAAGHDANKIFIENGRMHGTLIAARARGPQAP